MIGYQAMRAFAALIKKDLRGYFDQLTGYVFLCAFVGVSSHLFFQNVNATQEVSLRPLFEGILPILLLIFVPAATMRLIAEEQRDGTLEILLTQPVWVWSIVVAKFLSGLAFVVIGVASTGFFALALSTAGDLDTGALIAQYIGILLLTASLVSAGLFSSSLTRNQILAYVLAIVITGALLAAGTDLVVGFLPAGLGVLVQDISPVTHFSTMARGVVRLGDILYFAALVLVFLSGTYLMLRGRSVSHGSSLYFNLQLGAAGLVVLSVIIAWFGSGIDASWDMTEKKPRCR